MYYLNYIKESFDGLLSVYHFAMRRGGQWLEGRLYEGDDISKIEWRER